MNLALQNPQTSSRPRLFRGPALCQLASAVIAGVALAVTAASVTGPQPHQAALADPAGAAAAALPTDSYGLAASGGAAAAIAVGR